MSQLRTLFDKYDCDKSKKHGYDVIYDKLFEELKDEKINMLEIGVYKGASTRAFHEYFQQGQIDGLDLFVRTDAKDLDILAEERVGFLKTDSTNVNTVNLMKEFTNGRKYDIILDDGAHYPTANRLTFHYLKEFLAEGGMYIIEDVFPLELMDEKELNHPWLKKHSDRYSIMSNLMFLTELEQSGMKIERYDLRKKSRQPDSYIIVLRN